jgi:hypothetical protein
MRKSLWIILPVLLVAIGAPNAHATVTDYTISFTCTIPPGCLSPTSGSFEYNNTTNQFTSFQVVWDGFTFDLTVIGGGANDPVIGPNGSTPCVGTATGPQASLTIMTTCATDPTTNWTGLALSNGPQVFFRFLSFIDNNTYVAFFGNIPQSDIPVDLQDLAANGTFTTTITTAGATPEPGTAVLWLTGILLMIVMRKRLAQILRLDTGTHRSLSHHAHP